MCDNSMCMCKINVLVSVNCCIMCGSYYKGVKLVCVHMSHMCVYNSYSAQYIHNYVYIYTHV